jgi:hypothetical protein
MPGSPSGNAPGSNILQAGVVLVNSLSLLAGAFTVVAPEAYKKMKRNSGN